MVLACDYRGGQSNPLFKVIIDGHGGESYNIGNPVPEISMIELVKKIKKILNHRYLRFLRIGALELMNYLMESATF